MPCYFFTYHGYGTWMPDHPRGYVKRKEGALPCDSHMAVCYRQNLRDSMVHFDQDKQQLLIEAALEAFQSQSIRGHGIATESTHLHVLVSWTSDRIWQTVRQQLRGSLTRRLNRELGCRNWFSKQSSRKQVKEREHFEYLIRAYLPKHRGLKWCEEVGVFR